MKSSKAENVCDFLVKIVEQNPKTKIILILDNSRSHHADKTMRKAKELKMTLVILPPYSPDINPVEFVWKTIKREVSVRFIQSKEYIRNSIKNKFTKVEKSLSFAKKWMEMFNLQIKRIVC